MIVFDRAPDAVEWCLMLQELMMEVRWLFESEECCIDGHFPRNSP